LTVIEDYSLLIAATCATATDGGLRVIKGLSLSTACWSSTATATVISLGTTIDNIRACYWLKDAATVTNLVGVGFGLDDVSTDNLTQDCYCLDATSATTVKIFKFNVKNRDLIKIIDNCQFLVLPSIQESFGLVLVESWARKKAVITSDIPSLKEIVKSSNGGLTFKTDDIDDLQQKIQQLISNPKLCRQFGQNGYLYVKNNYTWNKVSQKICQKILPSV
jgi:glycosyltransferase involved in cell wall biosynthesis